MGYIDVVARAVIQEAGEVLFAECKSPAGERFFFLPGGHVDYLESAREALAREFQEEMGVAIEVGSFLGAIEHTFENKAEGRVQHELNLLFAASSRDLVAGVPPSSREAHLTFAWIPFPKLSTAPIYPEGLSEVLLGLANESGAESGHFFSSGAFARRDMSRRA